LNAAQEQRAAAPAELAVVRPDPWDLSESEVYAMVDSLGDIGASLNRADAARMQKIYKSLHLELIYDNDERDRCGDQALRGATGDVRGATCALAICLVLSG
jgi:hypothetical protein